MGENEAKVNENEEANTNTSEGENNEEKNNASQKTFTQEEVNKMMKAEKEKGRRSVLKDLGVENVTNAKSALEEYQKYLDSQKTDLQKANDDLANANQKMKDAENRATKAEYCLKAISKFNASAESVEDLVSIAISKMTDDKNIESVFKEMQENKAYSGFFNSDNNQDNKEKSKGTGNPINNGKTGNSNENYGAMLANKRKQKLNGGNVNGK